MLSLLLFPRWWIVEEEQECEVDDLEADHDIVTDAPIPSLLDDNPRIT